MAKKATKKTTKRAYTKKQDKVTPDKVTPDKVTTKKSVKRATADATKAVKSSSKRAGRPKGSGKFGCETKAVRIPTHMIEEVQNYILRKLKGEGKKK